MNVLKLYSLLFILIAFQSCSKSDDGNNSNQNGLANFQTTCSDGNPNTPDNQIIGPTGAYWEFSKTGIIPVNKLPVLQNPQLLPFPHSSPFISITLPQGYKAIESRPMLTNIANPLGIDIDRNDNSVSWDYVPISSYPGNFGVDDVMKVVIDNILFSYPIEDRHIDDVICSTTEFGTLGNNPIAFSARLLRFGRFTASVWINVRQLPLGGLSVASSVSVGPTNEFDNLVVNIFVPLSHQLLITDKETLSDRDNDGAPDIYDREPNNPNVQ